MQGKLSGAEMLSLATSGSEEEAAAMMGSLSPEVAHHSMRLWLISDQDQRSLMLITLISAFGSLSNLLLLLGLEAPAHLDLAMLSRLIVGSEREACSN